MERDHAFNQMSQEKTEIGDQWIIDVMTSEAAIKPIVDTWTSEAAHTILEDPTQKQAWFREQLCKRTTNLIHAAITHRQQKYSREESQQMGRTGHRQNCAHGGREHGPKHAEPRIWIRTTCSSSCLGVTRGNASRNSERLQKRMRFFNCIRLILTSMLNFFCELVPCRNSSCSRFWNWGGVASGPRQQQPIHFRNHQRHHAQQSYQQRFVVTAQSSRHFHSRTPHATRQSPNDASLFQFRPSTLFLSHLQTRTVQNHPQGWLELLHRGSGVRTQLHEQTSWRFFSSKDVQIFTIWNMGSSTALIVINLYGWQGGRHHGKSRKKLTS